MPGDGTLLVPCLPFLSSELSSGNSRSKAIPALLLELLTEALLTEVMAAVVLKEALTAVWLSELLTTSLLLVEELISALLLLPLFRLTTPLLHVPLFKRVRFNLSLSGLHVLNDLKPSQSAATDLLSLSRELTSLPRSLSLLFPKLA
uniref:Uncharacterized protein n=1 Tax=Arundo donax TaxID=35708 RepID=A0A0A9ABL7_ARUDO